jgi:hypothetical protein
MIIHVTLLLLVISTFFLGFFHTEKLVMDKIKGTTLIKLTTHKHYKAQLPQSSNTSVCVIHSHIGTVIAIPGMHPNSSINVGIKVINSPVPPHTTTSIINIEHLFTVSNKVTGDLLRMLALDPHTKSYDSQTYVDP